MKAVIIVAKIPIIIPEYIKAMGMDKMPVPKEAFSKCVNVSLSLEKKIRKTQYSNSNIQIS